MRYNPNKDYISITEIRMTQRNTVQGAIVLKTVNKLKCHATADEIYEEIAKDYPNIGRATVYRNLQKLCDAGQIRKVEVPEGADRYDHICKDHYHVRCVSCGKVFDMDMPYITGLEKTANDLHGFALLGHDIIFKGICPKCIAKNKINTGGQK